MTALGRLGSSLAVLLLTACNAPVQFETGSSDSAPDAAAPPGCQSEMDCAAASLHCDTVSHACVACLGDFDCEQPMPRCDFALHRCVECGSMDDCDQGMACASGHCLPACSDDTECPAESPTCDARGLCIRCTANADCDPSSDSSFCNVSSGRCVACLSNSQCRSSALPRCDPYRNVCVGCVSSADCAQERACNPTTGECVEVEGEGETDVED